MYSNRFLVSRKIKTLLEHLYQQILDKQKQKQTRKIRNGLEVLKTHSVGGKCNKDDPLNVYIL